VVLRIDSPGGSAYASDVIWTKLKELDEEKPVVVSMGSVAASGGYYIACPGRLIFAESTTITGSIGVISIIANQASALNRMDVNLCEIKHGARSLLGSSHRDMKPEDRECIQEHILHTYEQFLDRVADGRKMPKDEVRKIAAGRVYTGRDALELGLVDRLGTLSDAVDAVRDMADIPPSAEIKLVHYPRAASIGELVESFAGMSSVSQVLTQASLPAARVSFDSQVQYFGATQRPLCWMAVPDFYSQSGPMHLGLLTPDALQLFGTYQAPVALPMQR
jgi:protease-4